MNPKIRHTVLPLITAMIWGTAFSAQSMCADHVQACTLNAARGAIAFLLLLLMCVVRRVKITDWKALITGGLCCGMALCLASNLQQLGIETTSAGKAGFITALYIVLVPVGGVLLGKKSTWKVWLAVAIAVAGMYFLCMTEQFTVAPGDLYVAACALLFTVQIMCVDHFVQKVDGMALSCAQFLVVALGSSVPMFAFEAPTWAGLQACIWPLLYIAVFSSCVGYTLQIIAQKDANPTVVSLLLSVESVFAVIGGAVLLQERLTGRELLGCALMMAAVVLAELPYRKEAAANV